MGIPEAHYFAIADFLCCAAAGFGILPSNTTYAHLVENVEESLQILRRATYDRKTSAPDEYQGKGEDETDLIRNIFLE